MNYKIHQYPWYFGQFSNDQGWFLSVKVFFVFEENIEQVAPLANGVAHELDYLWAPKHALKHNPVHASKSLIQILP